MTTIHKKQLQQYTRQLQQYTQDNYNTHETTATIHTRQLEQYTQDNYNNTHKTTTTIHKRQLTTIHKRQLTTIHTRHLKIQHVLYLLFTFCTTCTKGKQHQGKKVLYTVCSIFSPHIFQVLTRLKNGLYLVVYFTKVSN